MKKALYWLVDHWYLPLFAIGVFLGWLWSTGKPKKAPVSAIKHELEAIKAGAFARKLEVELGAEKAAAEVKKQHEETLKALDKEQVAEAEVLKDDPVALSKFLVRAASGKRS